MIPSLKFEGAKELAAGLEELKGATAKKVVRDSITDSLVPVASAAASRVARLTGRLQRSIGIGVRLTKRQKRLNEPIVDPRRGVEAYVGPGVVGGRYDGRHGHLVEFGTIRMAPQPFMRPAWVTNLQAVFNRLASNMTDKLAAATKRAQRRALQVKRFR